jgi:hypothetical protein
MYYEYTEFISKILCITLKTLTVLTSVSEYLPIPLKMIICLGKLIDFYLGKLPVHPPAFHLRLLANVPVDRSKP